MRLRKSGIQRTQAGFTVAEMAVTLFVLALLIIGMLTLFDTMNKIGRVQTHVADLQQNLRVAQHDMVRMTRMAGRGGLLRGPLPGGFAVSVRNNVPDSGDEAFIAVADANSPQVAAGSDVLTLRGVFRSPLYQMNSAGPYFTLDSQSNPESGSMRVINPNPDTGVTQDLTPLKEVIDNGINAPILLVSPLSDLYAVVELDPAASDATNVNDITFGFNIENGTYTDEYKTLYPGGATTGFPQTLRSVSSVGLLEEIRFFVAEPDDVDSFEPRLTKAEFLAGTEVGWGADAVEQGQSLRSYVSDNIIDLQIALGVDANRDDVIDPATEWLFDDPADVDSDGEPVNAATTWNSLVGGPFPGLYYVRISTLARTDRQDLNFIDQPIAAIEDRIYNDPVTPLTDEERVERRHRRRLVETTVDMRNLS